MRYGAFSFPESGRSLPPKEILGVINPGNSAISCVFSYNISGFHVGLKGLKRKGLKTEVGWACEFAFVNFNHDLDKTNNPVFDPTEQQSLEQLLV